MQRVKRDAVLVVMVLMVVVVVVVVFQRSAVSEEL